MLTQFTRDSEIPTHHFLLVFSAGWCKPCLAMAHTLEEINRDSIEVQKVMIEDHPEIFQKFSIRNLPTFALMHNGLPVATLSGAQPKSLLTSWINTNHPTPGILK